MVQSELLLCSRAVAHYWSQTVLDEKSNVETTVLAVMRHCERPLALLSQKKSLRLAVISFSEAVRLIAASKDRLWNHSHPKTRSCLDRSVEARFA